VNCAEALQLVEAIAAGDVEVDAAMRAHFETCPRCASALASARRIEAALQARPRPQAPPRFTQTILDRVRTERWRTEERVDRIFNIAIVAAVILVAASIAALTNVDAVIGGAGSLWGLLAEAAGRVVATAAPMMFTYTAAAGLLISALLTWWWADRSFRNPQF
jgi:anti-sigma factor RsiW